MTGRCCCRRAERRHRLEVRLVVPQLLLQRGRSRIRLLRRRRLHHRQDRAVAVERGVEQNIALPPIQLVRNQRVDVRVDREMARRIEARRDSKHQSDQQRKRCKTGTLYDDRDNDTCQHINSF